MKASNPTQAAAVTIVDELVRCGVRHACLAPGSRSAPLALALAENDSIDLHVSLDERSAAFMALGIGRATGTPSIVLSTSGTAAANFFPAVQEASVGRVPLLVLTADRPPELRDTGANQWIDQIKLYGSTVRWFVEVGAPEPLPTSVPYWRSTAARAVAEATGSPPGPVHMNLAFREPLVEILSRNPGTYDGTSAPENDEGFAFVLDGRPNGAPWVDMTTAPRTLDDAAIAALAEELSGQRGLDRRGSRLVRRRPGTRSRREARLAAPRRSAIEPADRRASHLDLRLTPQTRALHRRTSAGRSSSDRRPRHLQGARRLRRRAAIARSSSMPTAHGSIPTVRSRSSLRPNRRASSKPWRSRVLAANLRRLARRVARRRCRRTQDAGRGTRWVPVRAPYRP